MDICNSSRMKIIVILCSQLCRTFIRWWCCALDIKTKPYKFTNNSLLIKCYQLHRNLKHLWTLFFRSAYIYPLTVLHFPYHRRKICRYLILIHCINVQFEFKKSSVLFFCTMLKTMLSINWCIQSEILLNEELQSCFKFYKLLAISFLFFNPISCSEISNLFQSVKISNLYTQKMQNNKK